MVRWFPREGSERPTGTMWRAPRKEEMAAEWESALCFEVRDAFLCEVFQGGSYLRKESEGGREGRTETVGASGNSGRRVGELTC